MGLKAQLKAEKLMGNVKCAFSGTWILQRNLCVHMCM